MPAGPCVDRRDLVSRRGIWAPPERRGEARFSCRLRTTPGASPVAVVTQVPAYGQVTGAPASSPVSTFLDPVLGAVERAPPPPTARSRPAATFMTPTRDLP